jgi:hypothetical protein
MHNHILQPNKKMKEIFFYLNVDKARKGKIPTSKNQEKQFWPNRRSQRITSTNQTLATFKKNDSHTCLNTLKKNSFYDSFLNEKKEAKAKINPKLLTAKIEIQIPERYNSHQGKG